jgi:hypothetical protein
MFVRNYNMRISHILLIALSVCFLGCEPDEDHDKDAILIKTFRDQRATFDELLEMIQSDRDLERVDSDWTQPNPPPISPERLSKYRQQLKSIGCLRGFEHFKGKPGVTFIASCVGTMSGSAKGYYFSEVTPDPLVKDLDAYRPEHSRGYEAYRHIEGGWYLIFESDD